jgi:hypothetical protein
MRKVGKTWNQTIVISVMSYLASQATSKVFRNVIFSLKQPLRVGTNQFIAFSPETKQLSLPSIR